LGPREIADGIYSIALRGEETLDNHKVLLLELLPKTDEVSATVENPVVVGRIFLAAGAATIFETGSGDYFNHPL